MTYLFKEEQGRMFFKEEQGPCQAPNHSQNRKGCDTAPLFHIKLFFLHWLFLYNHLKHFYKYPRKKNG